MSTTQKSNCILEWMVFIIRVYSMPVNGNQALVAVLVADHCDIPTITVWTKKSVCVGARAGVRACVLVCVLMLASEWVCMCLWYICKLKGERRKQFLNFNLTEGKKQRRLERNNLTATKKKAKNCLQISKKQTLYKNNLNQ